MNRRKFFSVALAIALPLALIIPLRALRSWQPRTLSLQKQKFGDEVSALSWTKEGILLARVVAQGRSDALALANWNGESVIVRVWQARVASPSRDGATMVTLQSRWAQGNGHIELWDVPAAQRREGATQTLQNLRPQRSEVRGTPFVALSPDGARMAWNDFGLKTARGVLPDRERIVLADARAGRPDAEFRLPQTDGGGTFMSPFVQGLAFSPDGRELAVVSYDALRILDAQTGKLRRWWHQPQFPQANELRPVWSPDGQTIALIYGSATSPVAWTGPRTPLPPKTTPYLWLINARSGQIVRSLSQTHARFERIGGAGLAFSPDGQRLAWGTFEGEAVIMNIASGAIERRFSVAKPDNSSYIAFAPDSNTLAVASQEKITLWRLH